VSWGSGDCAGTVAGLLVANEEGVECGEDEEGGGLAGDQAAEDGAGEGGVGFADPFEGEGVMPSSDCTRPSESRSAARPGSGRS